MELHDCEFVFANECELNERVFGDEKSKKFRSRRTNTFQLNGRETEDVFVEGHLHLICTSSNLVS